MKQNKQRNTAPPGSILKVWEGSIEVAKDVSFEAQMLSTMDITAFQNLPELAKGFQVKGKALLSQVTWHFQKVRIIAHSSR